MSCCRPDSEPPHGARRTPGSGGRSQTRPTGAPRDEAARTGRRPPRPPEQSEQSDKGKWRETCLLVFIHMISN